MKEEITAIAAFAAVFAAFYWWTTRNASAAPIAKTSSVVPGSNAPVYTGQDTNQGVLAYFYRDGM